MLIEFTLCHDELYLLRRFYCFQNNGSTPWRSLLIVREKIENNISYGSIVYMLGLYNVSKVGWLFWYDVYALLSF